MTRISHRLSISILDHRLKGKIVAVPNPTWSGVITTPVGPVRVTTTEKGLAEVHFNVPDEVTEEPVMMPRDVINQLTEYFSRVREVFTLRVDLDATTDFTRRVLEATAGIPYGETRTYGEIAREIGMPGATQAVGNALGANPVPIVIPCHRIVRSDGSMGWFTGGPHIKRSLLDLEGVHFPHQTTLPF